MSDWKKSPVYQKLAGFYKPQHTDLDKFGKGLASAFGKTEENILLDPCPKCSRRHWSHQSCLKP